MPPTNKMHHLKDYRPSAYGISHLDMDVTIAPAVCTIATKLHVSPAAGTKPGTPLILEGEELELVEIRVNGAPATPEDFQVTDSSLTLRRPPSDPFELETRVRVKPEENTSLMGLYRSSGTWCTQCEAEGFRRITYMADRPDVMATYRVRLEASLADAPVLLSNGNLKESGELPGKRHFAIWEDPFPKPTYLFAIVAGKLEALRDRFVTASGRKVDLAIYVEPGKTGRCAFAMDALKRSMKWDEDRFGREYDLDVFNIVAVSDFNFGAMENKGLNIFNDKYILADPQSATDADYYNIERIVAHEYFHNWTGNRITCRDWFQLCLKEGLTVYRDQEFTSDMRSRAVKRISDARSLRMHQFPEDAGPLAHPPRPDHYAEINNFYTSTVYDKGAEVVRMLATLLGEKDFARGCDLYFARHDGQATTIESWIKVFEDSTGRDLSQFTRWYTQAGTPKVLASGRWDEKEHTYSLTLAQHTAPTPGQEKKDTLVIPLKFGLVGPNGQDMEWEKVSGGTVEGNMIVLDNDKCELVFHGISAAPVLSILREFSAPVILRGGLDDSDKLFLARHDTDPFNRWQASQDIATGLLKEAASGDGEFDPASFTPDRVRDLCDALGETLRSGQLDDAFKALVLTLPGESTVSAIIRKNINPEKIHQARRGLMKQVAKSLHEALLETYHALAPTSPYSQDAAQVGARTLRNRCLMLLTATERQDMDELAARHYHDADNMSDRMDALNAIVQRWAPGAPEHLEDFARRFCADPLVLDKYLSLLARAPDGACLERVQEKYAETDFPKTNPNRLRALIGTFIMANPAQFTRPDGGGFAFATRVAMEIDRLNPQVSAALIEGFAPFENWEANRKEKARAELEKLAQKPGNSSDLSDILTRLLAVQK